MAGGGGEGEEEFANFQKFQLKLYTVSNYVTLLENFVGVLFCFFVANGKPASKREKEGRLSEERRKRRALRLRCTGREREGGKK